MRKFLLPAAALCACVLLLLFSETCADAARIALSVWWRSVIPSLFPFCVLLTFIAGTDFFPALRKVLRPVARLFRIHPDAVPCFLFGAIAGYPGGAKLCAMTGNASLAPFCNQCSPAFLLSVVAVGLFREPALFAPLCMAHYGSAILTAVVFRLIFGSSSQPTPPPLGRASTERPSLIASIQSGVSTMAAVGGCIVLFYVLCAVLTGSGVVQALAIPLCGLGVTGDHVAAVLHGLLEFTGGCAEIGAITSLSLRIRFALCAGFVSFGGVCVWLQSSLFLGNGIQKRYLAQKAVQGVIAGILAWLLTPLFCARVAEAAAQSAEPYFENAVSGGSILFSSTIALLSAYLAGIALASGERQKGSIKTQP